MNKADITARLNKVFETMFDTRDITITETTTAADIDGWDSLTHIDLICLIEERFAVQFTTQEVTSLHNVGELIGLIESKIDNQ